LGEKTKKGKVFSKPATYRKREWTNTFVKYILKKSDLKNIWDIIALKIFDVLLKESAIKLPGIGTIQVVLEEPKKIASIVGGEIKFNYYKSKILFKPDTNLIKTFCKDNLTTADTQKFLDGELDWLDKS
jgi:nucleoid DNA-binding protein